MAEQQRTKEFYGQPGSTDDLPTYGASQAENGPNIPPDYRTAHHPSAGGLSSDGRRRADPALKWGVTPSGPGPATLAAQELPADHPVHKISLEDQAKMRKKGINPVLKAEIDHAMSQNKSKFGKFWIKAGIGSGLGFNSAGGV